MNHLLPYKPAAVVLCEMHQVDPEEDVPQQHPLIAGATVNVKAWELRATALVDLSQMLMAMRIAEERAAPPVEH